MAKIVNNPGGMPNPGKIIKDMFFVKGILVQFFWNLHDAMFLVQDVEHDMHMLESVLGWKDAREILRPIVDYDAVDQQTRVMFRSPTLLESLPINR